MRKRTFDSYQKAIDFCYENDIPLENIEKFSIPMDLVWKYTVFYEKGESNGKRNRRKNK